MFRWSERYETGLELVDRQHKRLVDILNELYATIEADRLDETALDAHLQALVDYAHEHFSDEEALMAREHISEEHLRIHRMEHRSFIHDVERLRALRASTTDIDDLGQRTATFVTTWLAMHILGIDQCMTRQLRDIRRGADPADAFERHEDYSYDRRTTRALVASLLELWRDAEGRYEQLLARQPSADHGAADP